MSKSKGSQTVIPEITPEQKAAFHAKMVAGRLAKEKSRKEVSKK